MDTRWFKGNNPEAAKSLVLNSSRVLGKLTEILQEELDALDRQEQFYTDYDNPSWSHKQAHRNGDRAALLRVLKLLDVKDKK